MPDFKDIAALPTSWSLTIWDALPVFLSIEVAFAVVLVVLVCAPYRQRLWAVSASNVVGGIAYLALFDPVVALLMVGATVLQATIRWIRRPAPASSKTPESPGSAIRERGGAVIWDVSKSAAVAAIVKVLLAPAITRDSLVWLVVAVAGGLGIPGPIGTAAVPALAVAAGANSVLAAGVWLVAAGVRPLVVGWLSGLRSTNESADPA